MIELDPWDRDLFDPKFNKLVPGEKMPWSHVIDIMEKKFAHRCESEIQQIMDYKDKKLEDLLKRIEDGLERYKKWTTDDGFSEVKSKRNYSTSLIEFVESLLSPLSDEEIRQQEATGRIKPSKKIMDAYKKQSGLSEAEDESS